MKHSNQRRASRLFPFPMYGKWWISIGVVVLIALSWSDIIGLVRPTPTEGNAQHMPSDEILVVNRQAAAEPMPQISAETRAQIEKLFAEVKADPQNQEELLLSLKRTLQQTFEGQEDCWSCEGTEFFDRFDQIAGSGAARKPLGFREWIDFGDEAFDRNQLEEARKFYSQALQVIDERALDIEEALDIQAVSRVRDRCSQLDCR